LPNEYSNQDFGMTSTRILFYFLLIWIALPLLNSPSLAQILVALLLSNFLTLSLTPTLLLPRGFSITKLRIGISNLGAGFVVEMDE
jgi:uncharacterized membrane protein